MDIIEQFVSNLFAVFTDLKYRISIIYLCATVLLVYAIWISRGRPRSFVSFLVPKEVYLHKSNILDVKIFLFNIVLSTVGVMAAVTMTPLMTIAVTELLASVTGASAIPKEVTWGTTALATVIMILTLDFCKYWAHRLHHEVAVLWPFHSLHHSAEVMTPLTASRNHPVFLILRSLIYSFVVGTVQAFMLFFLMGKIDVLTIGTVNAGYFLFNVFGSNLRHSHVWLSYGPVMEHIFISPAQHHVHHSIDRKHYNKNYGEVFAIWDLMFGTLYVPKGYEKITYGLSDENSQRIEQPHQNLRTALLLPFRESWRVLRTSSPSDPESNRRGSQSAAP